MADNSPKRNAEPPLVDKILQYGKQAFDLTLSADMRRTNTQSLFDLLENTSTLSLMPVLNLLIQPGRVHTELHKVLISSLARLPLRPRGVQHTIEFVLSVHPSTSNASSGTGRGSSISHEALNASSRLLSSPPAGMSAQEWFNGIAPQLFSLLQGEGEPGMDRAAAYIIGFGILGRKQFGAPGMPGWDALVRPILGSIDPFLSRKLNTGSSTPHPDDHIETIGGQKILVTAVEFARSLRIFSILQNLTAEGRTEPGQGSWTYVASGNGASGNGAIHIEESNSNDIDVGLTNIDGKVVDFVDLLDNIPDLEADISDLFMALCRNWFAGNTRTRRPTVFTQLQPEDPLKEVQRRLIEAKLIQQMITKCPNKLVGDSRQVLDLVNQVLLDFLSLEAGKENEVGVSLSLLNIVLTAPSFRPNGDIETVLKSIKSSLGAISKMSQLEVSTTARNLLLFLTYRNSMEEPDMELLSTPTARQAEDRKTYNLAMSYLTAADSPPPVRAQGLELISTLVRANSPILDIPALLALFSSLLQDNDEYIYLRAIQSFDQLSQKHPKAVMKDLIDRYVDPTEEYDLDQRLRLGEALLHVIKSNYLGLSGEASRSVCDGLLFIASRRGYRPKTEREQEKKNKLKRKQDAEADNAWGGSVPQLDEVLEADSQADQELLGQIIGGWESKRGMEDVRIRASALAILGSAIEVNVEGLGSKTISTAVDLSIHILTLEPEPEKGILRRSAILLIMSFIKALDSARIEGKKLGFGLVGQSLEDVQRILEYVEGTDNDGLVRQHAKDVIEGLQSWQMNALIPPQREQTELQELAGLSITPRGVEDSSGRVRPRIEEIE
ncbi:hypothetical protein EG329_010333 [Mollisiaceae sp. DMI_Dod_QoI]|nr:hypothetical protein EG329_010333 [Helotiales sp. DMI_Dod_QoI]